MQRNAQPIGRDLKTIFLLVAILTIGVGAVMFLLPNPAGVGSAPPTQAPAGDQWWPWPLRTAFITRFLGALFVAVGVGSFWAAQQRTWGEVRVLFPPGITFTALATLASLIHFASFNQSRIATWAFFVLYIGVLLAGIMTFLRYERR